MFHAALRLKERYNLIISDEELIKLNAFIDSDLKKYIVRQWSRDGRVLCMLKYEEKPTLCVFDPKLKVITTFLPFDVRFFKR